MNTLDVSKNSDTNLTCNQNLFVYEMAVHISLTLLYLNDENCIVYPIVLNYHYPFKYRPYVNTTNVFTFGLKYAEMSTI